MRNEQRAASTAGYAEAAESLAEQYESVSFEEVHREILHLLPARPGRVLDVGAGTGRDAAALARRGHEAVAVEPTRELRDIGQRLHASTGIVWVDDGLPDLARLDGHGAFDLILLTAVWMHLDEAERSRGMARLASLLRPGGRIAMTLRHGPVPAGRRMFDVSAAETVEIAHRCGLAEVFRGRRDDMLGRADVHWSVLMLERPPS